MMAGAPGGDIKKVMVDMEGMSVRAWLKHFDRDNNGKIDFDEFCQGMQRLAYDGDVLKLWKDIDVDGSGELTLDEIDSEGADMWMSFRRWCATVFAGSKDMIVKMAGAGGQVVTQEQFVHFVQRAGWKGSFEWMLFRCLDTDDQGYFMQSNVKWLEVDKKKQRRKETAKAKAAAEQTKKMKEKLTALQALQEFKAFLKKTYGHFVRAWRRGLDLDGSMSVQKVELFKACRAMSWDGDVRAVWRALDSDDSGVTSLEELDAPSAQVLAQFKSWCEERFGSVRAAFKALDLHHTKKLKGDHFVEACRALGFTGKVKTLYLGLDWAGKHYVSPEDINFLEGWKPPAYLTSQANNQAADDLKALLKHRYKHYLKAWRNVLDKDNSNRVNWHEFIEACKKVGFRGDVPGAWLALDEDLSGSISLQEIDPNSSEALMGFKRWADEEFGGVRSTFKVLDADGGGDLTYREFKRACRDFGFSGDAKRLFDAFDSDGQGKLSLDEVVFLDDWEGQADAEEESRLAEEDAARQRQEQAKAAKQAKKSRYGMELATYGTDVPGPGRYDVLSTIGAPPGTPAAYHQGAFSFRKRTPLFGVPNVVSVTATKASPRGGSAALARGGLGSRERDNYIMDHPPPGPADYDPGVTGTGAGRKPSYDFGYARRALGVTGPRSAGVTPGPGAYDVLPRLSGPTFSMTPRRPVRLHPGQGMVGLKEDRTPRSAAETLRAPAIGQNR